MSETKWKSEEEHFGGTEYPVDNAVEETVEVDAEVRPSLEDLLDEHWGDEDEDGVGESEDPIGSDSGDAEETHEDAGEAAEEPVVRKSSDEWAELIAEGKKNKPVAPQAGPSAQEMSMFNALLASGRLDEAQALMNKAQGIVLPEEKKEYEQPANLDGFGDHPVIKQMEEFMANQATAQKEQQERQVYDNAITNVNNMIKDNESYELIEANNAQHHVVEAMLEYHSHTGKALGFEKACELIEKRLEEVEFERVERLKKTKKYNNRYGNTKPSVKKEPREKQINVKNGASNTAPTKITESYGDDDRMSLDEIMKAEGLL